ncbi:MAG: hypothetical protein SNJ75_02590 [Gemmataceae bacterium]
MLRLVCACVFLCGLLLWAADADTTVAFGELKSKRPAEWIPEKTTSKLRYLQFKLPKKGDDKEDAEIVVFQGISGSAKANIDRWKAQFRAPAGKKPEDLFKESKLKVDGCDVYRLEAEGIFTATAMGFGPKPTPKEGYKGVFFQFETGDNVYHIRLVGPTKTVEHYQKGYEEWVKGFKK